MKRLFFAFFILLLLMGCGKTRTAEKDVQADTSNLKISEADTEIDISEADTEIDQSVNENEVVDEEIVSNIEAVADIQPADIKPADQKKPTIDIDDSFANIDLTIDEEDVAADNDLITGIQ